jgi:hypothetical protein
MNDVHHYYRTFLAVFMIRVSQFAAEYTINIFVSY